MYEMSKRLTAMGVRVTIISSLRQGQKTRELVDGIEVNRIRAIKNRYLLKVSMVPGELRLLKVTKPDIVHANDPISAALCTSFYDRRRTVMTFHGVGSSKSEWPTPFRQLARMLQVISARSAGAVTTTDARTAEIVLRWRKGISIIPGGVDTGLFRKGTYPIPESMQTGRKNLVFIGRLNAAKGIDILLDSLGFLPEKMQKGLALIVIGSGPMADLVRDYHESNVKVIGVGEIPHGSIPAYLSSADMFVMPSRSEGLPLSLLEAMSSELPAVCSTVGGIGASFDERHFTAISDLTPSGIAQALEYALNSETAVRSKSLTARRLVEQEYSWDAVAARFLTLYKELVL